MLLPIIVLATPLLLSSAGDDQSRSAKTDKESESVYGATVVNRIIAGEKLYNTQLREYSPRIESYVQYYEGETDLGEVPKKDAFYLGRLSMRRSALRFSCEAAMTGMPYSPAMRLSPREFAATAACRFSDAPGSASSCM